MIINLIPKVILMSRPQTELSNKCYYGNSCLRLKHHGLDLQKSYGIKSNDRRGCPKCHTIDDIKCAIRSMNCIKSKHQMKYVDRYSCRYKHCKKQHRCPYIHNSDDYLINQKNR